VAIPWKLLARVVVSRDLFSPFGTWSHRFPLHLFASTAGNDFDGQLPSDLGRLEGLKILEVSNNAIVGTIPTEFGLMADLEELRLNENAGISGPLPSELGLCTELEVLNVKDTGISGIFPTVIGDLPNLEQISVEGTDISGNFDTFACTGQYVFVNANCVVGAQINCACCNTCCDSNGRNCV
jgi:hypothetical protein